MTALYEKFRPCTWEQVVGQSEAVRVCKGLALAGLGGRAVAFQGSSGVGKSTLARLLASEIADPMNVVEVDAQWLTPTRIADLEGSLCMYGLGVKTGRVVICNEYHALSRESVQQFLTTLERIPSHAAWLFTCTNDGAQTLMENIADATPFGSRCLTIKLAQRGLGLADAFPAMVRANMGSIGMDGHPIDWYVRLAKDCRNNARMMYERAEYAALAGD